LPFIFTEAELILRQAQDDRFLKKEPFSASSWSILGNTVAAYSGGQTDLRGF
jgi:hypothetical protein